MRRFLLCAALVLLPAMGFAQDYDTGVAAYNAGDFAAALREWRPLAKQGNAAAQTNFGVMYVRGEGVPQDDAEAVKWYQLAADQGYALGQFSLGTMYSAGVRSATGLRDRAHVVKSCRGERILRRHWSAMPWQRN